MLERQVAHMVRLIDDLLDVSRITRAKSNSRRSGSSWRRVVGNAVEISRPMIGAPQP